MNLRLIDYLLRMMSKNSSTGRFVLINGPNKTEDKSEPAINVSADTKSTVPVLRFKRAKANPVLMRGRKGKSVAATWPPEIDIECRVRRQVLRFETTNAVSGINGIITATDIFGAIGVIGRVTNSSVTAIAQSFRLKRVTIWPSGSTSGVVLDSISWASDDDHDPAIKKNGIRPAGIVGEPSAITAVPPRNSTSGFWMRDTVAVANVAMVYLEISGTGSIVDLELEWTSMDGISSSQSITVATAVVGTFYRLYLNKVAAANTLKPVDFPSTT